jgi:hypothetical protein
MIQTLTPHDNSDDDDDDFAVRDTRRIKNSLFNTICSGNETVRNLTFSVRGHVKPAI